MRKTSPSNKLYPGYERLWLVFARKKSNCPFMKQNNIILRTKLLQAKALLTCMHTVFHTGPAFWAPGLRSPRVLTLTNLACWCFPGTMHIWLWIFQEIDVNSVGELFNKKKIRKKFGFVTDFSLWDSTNPSRKNPNPAQRLAFLSILHVHILLSKVKAGNPQSGRSTNFKSTKRKEVRPNRLLFVSIVLNRWASCTISQACSAAWCTACCRSQRSHHIPQIHTDSVLASLQSNRHWHNLRHQFSYQSPSQIWTVKNKPCLTAASRLDGTKIFPQNDFTYIKFFHHQDDQPSLPGQNPNRTPSTVVVMHPTTDLLLCVVCLSHPEQTSPVPRCHRKPL